MSPLVKYTLGRLGLFLAVFLVLWPVPALSLLVKLLVALLASFGLSWFLLRGWRDELAANLAEKVERRRVEKERLRGALAGDDDPNLPPPARDEPV
ncbi:MAG: DUF4229 domain-containing protein [Micromonosporaceae bacterium]|nr:DUF4229 domain-containing protein [Micromonosporaceae bacterium]